MMEKLKAPLDFILEGAFILKSAVHEPQSNCATEESISYINNRHNQNGELFFLVLT